MGCLRIEIDIHLGANDIKVEIFIHSHLVVLNKENNRGGGDSGLIFQKKILKPGGIVMLKKLALLGTSLSLLLPITVGAAGTESSCSVSSMVGDNDYFGGDCYDIKHEPEDGVFDSWDNFAKSWTHTYAPISTGAITSATLTIVMYSNDEYEPDMDLGLFVEGVEIANAFDVPPTHHGVNTFVFNLDPAFYSKLEDGSAQIEVRNVGQKIDLFALDYATLDITYNCKTKVTIDIKPASDPSSFGANSNGKIPVALFGSANLDVTQIDDSTVRFGDSENSGAYAFKSGGLEDKNGDGFMDKVYHFNFQETNLDPGDTVGYLTGTLFNGKSFVGSSDVNIVGATATVAPDEEVIDVEDDGKKMKLKVKK